MTDFKIDVVYLWVDDTDKKWRTEKEKWFKKITGKELLRKDSVGAERFRDNGELMYSLRSVAECIPWINHIYIITGFNQVPKWLNTKHKKITVVSDTEIMPADALPTFSSGAIEKCLPNIPGLSEHFLLMNDDMFFNKKLSPSYFFDNNGNAKYVYSSAHKLSAKELNQCSAYQAQIYFAQEAISNLYHKNFFKYAPSHGIDPYIKSSMLKCLNEPSLYDKFQSQIRNKFRTANEFQRFIFNLYDFANGQAKFIHARAKKYGRHKLLNAIYNILHAHTIRNSNIYVSNVVGKENLLKQAPTFCINDGPENDIAILKQNREFLETRFPNKSEFEK